MIWRFVICILLLSSCGKKEDETVSPTLSLNKIIFNYTAPSAHSEIFIAESDGSSATSITSGGNTENWWPKISPDRTKILYYRAPAGTNEDYAQADLMVYSVENGSTQVLRAKGADGWTLQAHAEWSPDGNEVVTCGTQASTVHIFTLNALNGQIKKQLTTNGGWNCDPAWSPDGLKIIFNRCVGVNCHSTFGQLDIFIMNATDGSSLTPLTTADGKDDYDPYYSPDGTKIAWLHQVNTTAWSGAGAWSIKKMTSNGSGQSFVINDTNINSKPSWSKDGSKLFFHRMAPVEAVKYRLFTIQYDGTLLTEISPFGPYAQMSVGSISYPEN